MIHYKIQFIWWLVGWLWVTFLEYRVKPFVFLQLYSYIAAESQSVSYLSTDYDLQSIEISKDSTFLTYLGLFSLLPHVFGPAVL